MDKTIAILQPKGTGENGYIIFIFNCQGLQSSTKWFAFIRQALNVDTFQERRVLVTVPDLDNLQIQVNTHREGVETVDQEGKAMVNGNLITAEDIVERCMNELRKVARWTDVLEYWEKNYEMGLCWKRYDRIEWLKGGESAQDELAASWSLQKVDPTPSLPF